MKKRYSLLFVSALLFGLGLMAVTSPGRIAGAREVPPDQAIATFEIAEGFQIELVASEPLVADPVAMEIDELGRMYVVEMHGYPLDKSGTGKIKILTDTDGDGAMDKSAVFAEGLMLPTGILRWKKGVLVTDAPNVLYLEDSDGDGRADVRDTLLTGFALSNPQHNLNNPTLGLDNWIYLCHESAISTQAYKEEFGDRGGEVYYPGRRDSPRLPQNASGRGVRLRPDRNGLEVLASNSQFGHTFDPWGHYFVVSNANHVIHQAIAATYLNRNPGLLVGSATQSISDHGRAAEVFPITQNPLNQLLTDVGVFTSACGSTFYQGGLFPAPFDQVNFVAEPVSNLVHADVLRDKGATFEASRLYADKEFLASTDAWFRPVNMYVGPDGALYVVDYYRQIIEHPEWMAEDVIKSGALYNGTDQGRIYRITPKGTKPANWTKGVDLGTLSDQALVQKLADANSWWRRHAQRLLIDRKALGQVGTLEKMALQNPGTLGRLHALWTLEGLGKLNAQLVSQALTDPSPGVRENAIRLAEPFLNSSPTLIRHLISLQEDANEKVRYQLLCTLGNLTTPEANAAREKLLFRDMQDPWVQVAALSALPAGQSDLLGTILSKFDPDKPEFTALIERLSTMAATTGSAEDIHAILNRATSESNRSWAPALLRGLATGLKNNKEAARTMSLQDREAVLRAATGSPMVALRESSIQLLQTLGPVRKEAFSLALEKTSKTAFDKKENPEIRTAAIHFLALGDAGDKADELKKLLNPAEPLTVQLAALQTLAALPGTLVSEFVIAQWPTLTPGLRNAAISSFLSSDARIALLLDALEKGTVDPGSIGWPRTVSLMNQKNIPLRDRSRALLAQRSPDEQAVLRKYESALALRGIWESGKAVYAKNCAVCHQIGGTLGTAYGPDLGTIRNRQPESILGDILNPNRSIADGFDFWSLEKQSGETLEGLISVETPTSVTLRSYGGAETIIARSAIKSLKALGVSVMPTGLEKQINPQEMADLLAFLKNRK